MRSSQSSSCPLFGQTCRLSRQINRRKMQFGMLGPAGMLGVLDAIAAARDLPQLEQHEMQAQMFKTWLEHEAGVASAAAGMDPRPCR